MPIANVCNSACVHMRTPISRLQLELLAGFRCRNKSHFTEQHVLGVFVIVKAQCDELGVRIQSPRQTGCARWLLRQEQVRCHAGVVDERQPLIWRNAGVIRARRTN